MYTYQFHYIQNGKLIKKESSLRTPYPIYDFEAAWRCQDFEIDNQRPYGTVSMYSVKDNAYLHLSSVVADFIE